MRLSIRYKILIVLGFLLLVAVSCYTFLATSIFRQEKTALLYDINHSTAVNAAAQLRANLVQVGEQIRVYVLSDLLSKTSSLRLPKEYLISAGIHELNVYEKKEGLWSCLSKPEQTDPPSPESYLAEANQNSYAFWSEKLSDEQKFFIATRIEVNQENIGSIYVGVARLDPKVFLATLTATNLFTAYLVQKNRGAMLHLNRGEYTSVDSAFTHPLADTLRQNPSLNSGVRAFPFEGKEWYGAYASVGIAGLYFISQASQTEVNAAIENLIERSLLFGLIVVTATFLVSILFSKRLTRNLQRLTALARQIGQGNLTTKIHLNSRDEVEELASSFNKMIDDLKASREAIEKYNRELEEKVALRTEQLRETNATIKEVQEKLLKSSQYAVAGEVAGRTAHEVLNPLTAILSRIENALQFLKPAPQAEGNTDASNILEAWESELKTGGIDSLIQSWKSPSSILPNATLLEEDISNLKTLISFWGKEQQTLQKDFAFVQDQAYRIQRIVDQMRALVRTDSQRDEVDCHEAIRNAVNIMMDYTQKQGIHIALKLSDESPIVLLNRDEFIQLLTNLIRNSSQAILSEKNIHRKVPGHIEIKTQILNEELQIDVIDNGAGVPPEEFDKVFEAGFTTKSPLEGTGLGLSICRRYARSFGGEVILAYSETHGRGTCFRITFPLVKAHSLKAVG